MSLLIQHLVGKRALIEDYRLTARKIIEVALDEIKKDITNLKQANGINA